MLPYKRSERVRKLLHKKVSQIIMELKDPRLGFVTITDAEITEDFKVLKLFYSVLGSEKEKNDTTVALKSAVSFIRTRIADEVDLRFVPEIIFVLDKSIERAQKVFDILKKINLENNSEDK